MQEPLPPDHWRPEQLFEYLIFFELIPEGEKWSEWYNDPKRMLLKVKEDIETDKSNTPTT